MNKSGRLRPYGFLFRIFAVAAGLQGFGGELVEVGLISSVLGKSGRSLAELSGANGVHAIAHRDNRVQVVVLNLPRDLAKAFLANYPIISDSCRLR